MSLLRSVSLGPWWLFQGGDTPFSRNSVERTPPPGAGRTDPSPSLQGHLQGEEGRDAPRIPQSSQHLKCRCVVPHPAPGLCEDLNKRGL